MASEMETYPGRPRGSRRSSPGEEAASPQAEGGEGAAAMLVAEEPDCLREGADGAASETSTSASGRLGLATKSAPTTSPRLVHTSTINSSLPPPRGPTTTLAFAKFSYWFRGRAPTNLTCRTGTCYLN